MSLYGGSLVAVFLLVPEVSVFRKIVVEGSEATQGIRKVYFVTVKDGLISSPTIKCLCISISVLKRCER